MKIAPIILFVYNRPQHTLKTLKYLNKNEYSNDSTLYIFADGFPENSSAENIENIKKTRKVIQSEKWCKETIIKEHDVNKGLAKSIIEGVTEIIEKHGRAIILEDDMLTSPVFLRFMNEALNKYEDKEEIISICGYMYPITNLPDTLFLRGADCWGWASWKRGWDLFELNGLKLLSEIKEKNLESQFDYENSHQFTQMLENQVSGSVNSWAIRWYASAFLKNKLTLYPGKSLIKNIGFDGSGIHSGDIDYYKTELHSSPISLDDIEIKHHENAFRLIKNYFKSIHKKKKLNFSDLLNKMKQFLRKLLQ